MNPWTAKAVVLAATVVMIAIRAPYGQRSRSVKVAKSHKTPLETGILVLAWVGFFVPLIWVASPAFSFAEYPLRSGPLISGVVCFVIGLWLFYRSHADLGTNWSITLEIREQHQLITQGVYRRIRHPMSSALALYAVAHVLVIPNWVAGLWWPDENSCRNSSTRCNSKNTGVSRPAVPRPAAGARGLRLQLPDGLVLNIGVTTQRDRCVSSHTEHCLESSARPEILP